VAGDDRPRVIGASTGPDSAIEVSNLTKRFGGVTAVRDLSFSVPRGQVTGFLGPNGAGKTTTMRVMLGLAAPDEGTALVQGRPYADLDDPIRRVGTVLESTGFHPGRTGREHLRLAARAARISPDRVDAVLDQVAMHEVADRRVRGYSSGMRQRLGLAAALLGDPELLVLDEPANGLDPAGVAWLRGFLRAFVDAGRTVLVSSHQLAEMAQTADRLVVIDRGRLIRDGPVGSITSAVAREVLVRSPEAARLRAALDSEAGVGVSAGGSADVLSVTGMAIERVGEIAAAEGIVLHELTAREASLEEAFLHLTGEQPAGPPVVPPPPGAGP
jgi:ABC-2 type transport system ATP-binding protein